MSDGAAATAAAPETDWGMGPKADVPAPKAKRARRADHTVQTSAPAEPVEDRAPDLRRIPLELLHESVSNPRKLYDPAQLQELADSLARGQLTPCLVRPHPSTGGFEIAAGHRRYRAAKLAGLTSLLCVVREMDDSRLLETLIVENDQRADVHPLEEAQGYKQLMEQAGYDVAQIAARVGRSVKYVYDRMKLLQLTKEAKALFLAGEMTAGHAILLARLAPKDQARAIASDRSGNGHIGGLYVPDYGETLFDDEDAENVRKPVGVREFAKWIDDRVRFDRERKDLPDLFPATAAAIGQATERRETVVAITHDYQCPPEARAEERTYGPLSWKRADGEKAFDPYSQKTAPSKACEHAVTGVIVIGPGRGEAFKVCVAKGTCRIHWPEKKKVAATGGAKDFAEQERHRRDEEKTRQAKREAAAKRWKKALPALRDAVVRRIKALPAKATGALADILIEELLVVGYGCRPATAIPRGSSAEDLVRHAAGLLVAGALDDWNAPEGFAAQYGKRLGVDVAKIVDAADPEGARAAADKKAGIKELARFKGAKKKGKKK